MSLLGTFGSTNTLSVLFPPTIVVGKNSEYEITRLIAKGGMAEVYEAKSLALGRPVALKKLSRASFNNDQEFDEAKKAFEREKDIMVSLCGVAPKVWDFFCSNAGDCYLVMELLLGEDLGATVKSGRRFSETEVKDIGLALLEDLEVIHRVDIIYRDMKPGNIMWESMGMARLVDFGIARPIRDDGIQGQTNKYQTRIGTLEYAPPEQYSGHADFRSDLYSLGLTLATLLTGHGPDPFRLQNLEPYTDNKPLIKFLQKATQLDPDKRFQTAIEMKRALAKIKPQQKTVAINIVSASVIKPAFLPKPVVARLQGLCWMDRALTVVCHCLFMIFVLGLVLAGPFIIGGANTYCTDASEVRGMDPAGVVFMLSFFVSLFIGHLFNYCVSWLSSIKIPCPFCFIWHKVYWLTAITGWLLKNTGKYIGWRASLIGRWTMKQIVKIQWGTWQDAKRFMKQLIDNRLLWVVAFWLIYQTIGLWVYSNPTFTGDLLFMICGVASSAIIGTTVSIRRRLKHWLAIAIGSLIMLPVILVFLLAMGTGPGERGNGVDFNPKFSILRVEELWVKEIVSPKYIFKITWATNEEYELYLISPQDGRRIRLSPNENPHYAVVGNNEQAGRFEVSISKDTEICLVVIDRAHNQIDKRYIALKIPKPPMEEQTFEF